MNDGIDENDTRKKRDEDSSQVFQLYKSAYSNFQKSFSILLGFSLIFVFVFLFPYISTLDKSNNIDHRIATLDHNISKHSDHIRYLNIANNGLQNLSLISISFPTELKNAFTKLKHYQLAYQDEKFVSNVNKFLNQPQDEIKLIEFSHILSNLSKELDSLFNFNNTINNKAKICEMQNVSLSSYCALADKIHNQVTYFLKKQQINYGLQDTRYLFPSCDLKYQNGSNQWAGCNLNEKMQSHFKQLDQDSLSKCVNTTKTDK